MTDTMITREQVYREEAVRRVAGQVMSSPIQTLNVYTIDAAVQREFTRFGRGDTRIAFIDQVLAQMTLPHWHAADDHVEWFRRNFVGASRPISAA